MHKYLLSEVQYSCAGSLLLSIKANESHREISAGCKGDAEIFSLFVPFHLLQLRMRMSGSLVFWEGLEQNIIRKKQQNKQTKPLKNPNINTIS